MTRNEVLSLAREYAVTDSLQRSIDGSDRGPRSDAEVIVDYLADVNPYPDGTEVKVLDRISGSWESATIIERAWPNEWRVTFDNSALGRKWADHTEIQFLRPADHRNHLEPAQ